MRVRARVRARVRVGVRVRARVRVRFSCGMPRFSSSFLSSSRRHERSCRVQQGGVAAGRGRDRVHLGGRGRVQHRGEH